jgi:Lipocalin-like domain
MRRFAIAWIALLLPAALLAADTLEGRWKLVAAEDVRANGEVVRKPWGEHPVGSIVVQAGPQGSACYLQIMSTDTPQFNNGSQPMLEQMSAKLRSSYIAYSGLCTYSEADGTVSLKVDAAWQPNYVGTEQKRIFHFENGKLIFGTLPNTIRLGSEQLTRRLTLERVP